MNMINSTLVYFKTRSIGLLSGFAENFFSDRIFGAFTLNFPSEEKLDGYTLIIIDKLFYWSEMLLSLFEKQIFRNKEQLELFEFNYNKPHKTVNSIELGSTVTILARSLIEVFVRRPFYDMSWEFFNMKILTKHILRMRNNYLNLQRYFYRSDKEPVMYFIT